MTFYHHLILRGMVCQASSAWKSFLATGTYVQSVMFSVWFSVKTQATLGKEDNNKELIKAKSGTTPHPILILCWPLIFFSLSSLGLQKRQKGSCTEQNTNSLNLILIVREVTPFATLPSTSCCHCPDDLSCVDEVSFREGFLFSSAGW